jgi:uncharacterized membrane protein YfcA
MLLTCSLAVLVVALAVAYELGVNRLLPEEVVPLVAWNSGPVHVIGGAIGLLAGWLVVVVQRRTGFGWALALLVLFVAVDLSMRRRHNRRARRLRPMADQ